jgi:hypothetical protein
MRSNAFLGCAVAALASLGAPGLAQERRAPPLVEEYPTDGGTIKATYSCSKVYSIELELQEREDIVALQSLKIAFLRPRTGGRTLSEADRKHVNARLMKFRDLTSYVVYCAEGGMILAVHGALRGPLTERKSGTVAIWWNEKGVRDLDFE